MSARTWLVSFAVAAAVVVMGAGPAAANPNRVFSGKIMLSDKRFPTQAKSASAYTAKIKSMSKTNFVEDKAKKSWRVYLAAFLKSPLNDIEYNLKVYELSGRGQQLLLTFEQFADERGQKTILSNIVLERKHVGVNKDLLVTIENRGRVLASSRMRVLGEGERFKGKVDFSEEEAAGRGGDD